MNLNQEYWSKRYQNDEIGWDIGHISTPLKAYFDQLNNKNISILIPGGGNSYEAEYLFHKGFKNVFVVDIAKEPLVNLTKRYPDFPKENLLHHDFFELNETFDLIVEQTFFCALNPTLREQYVTKTYQLLNPKGKLVGLLFDAPLNENHPPFGGCKEEYLSLFDEHFQINVMETAHNSIEPRKEKELFINFTKN